MKRVSLDRIARAKEASDDYVAGLHTNHPGKLLFGVLALRAAGLVPDGATRPLTGTELVNIFNAYCDIPGSAQVYFDPFTGPKYANWPRGSVLTRFKDTAVLTQNGKLRVEGSGTVKDYSLQADYLDVVRDEMLPQNGVRYPLADLVALRYRHSRLDDNANVQSLVEAVVTELGLTDDEVATMFAPVEYTEETDDAFFTDDDWSPESLIEALGMTPAAEAPTIENPDPADGWEPPDDQDLLAALRAEMEALHFDVSIEFLANFITAVRTDRFVILGGKPGTGKSRFVQKFAEALRNAAVGTLDVRCFMFPVTDESAEWQLVGMRDLEGQYVPSELMKAVSDLAADGVALVVLDEMNLAPVDVYGARLLSAVTNGIAFELPGTKPDGLSWYPSNGLWEAPPGLVIVGTINSPLQEPNRLALSGPVKRRSNVIPMPDRLAEVVALAAFDEDEARLVFESLCSMLMAQLRDSALQRAVSALDKPVTDRLSQALRPTTVDVLWSLALLVEQDSHLPVTLGLIQSILGYVQVASAQLPEVAAIDRQLVQKLLPVLRGHPDILGVVSEALKPWHADLPATLRGLDELRILSTDSGHVTPIW